LLTGLGEALYFNLAFHAPFERVLMADFSLQTGVRPAVIVFAFSVIVLVAGLVREYLVPPVRPRPRFA
jgi:hypothetical protein